MRDDAWDQDFAVRKLDVLPHFPFVFMPWVCGFERIGAGADLEDEIDDIFELHVVNTRTHIDAVTGMKTDFLRRDIAQRMIESGDAQLGPFAAIFDARFRMDDVIRYETRVIDLH